MAYIIPFNKPYLSGMEIDYVKDAINSNQISGNGKYTKMCQSFFEKKYGIKKCLLTTSCTDALEMSAILLNIKDDDEVIIPSYTFVSTANAFVLRGANVIFTDSMENSPCIDADKIENLITPKTKAIVVVHYAGYACEMDKIMDIAKKYNLFVVEDAAQSIDNYHINHSGEKKALGTIGHLATFSFHETKNIISGEGGLLAINDDNFIKRAEIIWEKGTNRSSFFRGEVDKYGWVDLGSSFLPSELIAAFLWAQLEKMEDIQKRRLHIWNLYFELLKDWAREKNVLIGTAPPYSTNNAHIFFLVFKTLDQRTLVIEKLKENQILSVFHYLSLHKSDFYKQKHDKRELYASDKFSDTLLRLPLFYELTDENITQITNIIKSCNI